MTSDCRQLLQADRLIAGDDALAVDLDAGNTACGRPGGDDDFPGFERLLVALEDVDLSLPSQSRRPLDPVDFVFLEEKLDSLRQSSDDPILARLHLGHVNRWSAGRYRDAPLPGVPDDLERMRMLEQCLGRNASPDEAGPAEGLLFFDDGYFLSKLGAANRGNIAARTRADDHHVIRTGQGSSFEAFTARHSALQR